MNNEAKYKKFLLSLVKRAGDAIIKDYNNPDSARVKLKTPRDLVTAADLKSEKIIISAIKKNFPGHRILSEESGLTEELKMTKKTKGTENPGDYLWIVDPLDGTTNFFMHNPLWSVSIALAYKRKLIIGAIYAPLQKELFYACLGRGAYLNGKRIKINNSPLKPLHAFCNGRDNKNIKRVIKYFSYNKLHSLDCRQLGSAALELAYVAAGRLSSFMIPGAWDWDAAAGVLLVREAGGKVTDFSGKNWRIGGKNILAAAAKLHAPILKVIKRDKI